MYAHYALIYNHFVSAQKLAVLLCYLGRVSRTFVQMAVSLQVYCFNVYTE